MIIFERKKDETFTDSYFITIFSISQNRFLLFYSDSPFVVQYSSESKTVFYDFAIELCFYAHCIQKWGEIVQTCSIDRDKGMKITLAPQMN